MAKDSMSREQQAYPPGKHSTRSNRSRSRRGERNVRSSSSGRRRQKKGKGEENSATRNPGQRLSQSGTEHDVNAMDMSELSLCLEDLQIIQQQSKQDITDTIGSHDKGDRETRRRGRKSSKKRGSSHDRPSNPKNERRRDNSIGPDRVQKELEKRRCHSQGRCPYKGAMVKMVEQMHGSGSTLDYQDSLRLSRHSRKRYSETILQTRKPTTQQDSMGHYHLNASAASSSVSSFAVASQHEWTGWSSSSSTDPRWERSSVDDLRIQELDHRINSRNDMKGSRSPKTQKRKSQQEAVLAPATAMSKVPANNQSIILSNSSHSTPLTRRKKLADIDKMYSSAPCRINHQKVKDRSVFRLKELISSYEGPKVGIPLNSPTEALPPVPSLEDFVSPLRTPNRHVGKIDSGDTTVRQTNRSHDLVDPEEATQKHTNISYEKKSRQHWQLPPPTSRAGYYSPWRAATIRRMSALADDAHESLTSPHKKSPRVGTQKQSTPRTHPLTDTPRTKRAVETNVMLSEISAPPLLSPHSPRTRVKKGNTEQKSPRTNTKFRKPDW